MFKIKRIIYIVLSKNCKTGLYLVFLVLIVNFWFTIDYNRIIKVLNTIFYTIWLLLFNVKRKLLGLNNVELEKKCSQDFNINPSLKVIGR